MPPGRARTLTLVATALGSAVAFLDTTVVIVALPRMEEDLGLGLAGQQWVLLAYSLTLSAFYVVGGALGDRAGLRRTFVGGVVLFAAASLLTALAPDEGLLLAGRALQGVGGAVLTTTSLALLRVTWAGEAGRAIGLWTALTSAASIAGPLIGGLVVEAVSWRFVFLVNVPLAAVTVLLALAGRSGDERPPQRAPLDLVGAALVAAGLTGVTFGLVEAQDRGIGVLVPLAAGIASLVALVAWTRRTPQPIVPPSLLRVPGLAAANLVTLVLYAALGAHLLFLPVFLQFVGFGPALSGLAFAPPGLALVLLASSAGRLADRRGSRLPVALGSATVALAVLLLLPVSSREEAWTWGSVSIVLFALGLAGIVSPITSAALAPAPERLAGIASGLNQTVARVGGILSVAAVGALAAAVFAARGVVGDTPFDPGSTGAAREAGIDAFRAVVLSVAGLALVGALLAVLLLPGARQIRTPSSRSSATLRSSPPP